MSKYPAASNPSNIRWTQLMIHFRLVDTQKNVMTAKRQLALKDLVTRKSNVAGLNSRNGMWLTTSSPPTERFVNQRRNQTLTDIMSPQSWFRTRRWAKRRSVRPLKVENGQVSDSIETKWRRQSANLSSSIRNVRSDVGANPTDQ